MIIEEYQRKLESNETLTEHELEKLISNIAEVHEEVRDRGSWREYVSTVFKFDGCDQLWCIDWERFLTESGDNMFYEQPYKVSLKHEDVIVTKTTIIKKDTHNE